MITNKLSEILGRKRIRIMELSRWSGVSYSTLHRLYSDETRKIDFNTLDRICVALECTPNDILEFKKPENPSEYLKIKKKK